MLSGLAVLALGTVASTTVEAQACQGLNSPTNLQLSAGAGSGFKEFGAGLAFGKSTGVFAGVGGHYTKFNHDAGHSIGADGTLGYQVSAGSGNKLAVCPVATLGFSSGPNFGDEKFTDIDASGGLSIGIPVKSSGSKMSFIPTASLALIYDRTKVTFSGTGTGQSGTSTDGLGLLSGGVGILFSPSFALRPMFHIPFATPGSKASFDLTASIGFGKTM